MNLEQARSRKFDDILYAGYEILKGSSSLPAELLKTDEWFLESTFSIFNSIEKNNPIIFHQKRNTGITTALQFIVSYYSLHYPQITILTNAGSYIANMKKVYEMFGDFLKLKYDSNFMSNKIILKYEGVQYCEISMLSVLNFNIADLKGPVIFDANKDMNNYSKYDDLLKNKKKYDKFVLNFPNSESIAKLAEEYKIEKQIIKIF